MTVQLLWLGVIWGWLLVCCHGYGVWLRFSWGRRKSNTSWQPMISQPAAYAAAGQTQFATNIRPGTCMGRSSTMGPEEPRRSSESSATHGQECAAAAASTSGGYLSMGGSKPAADQQAVQFGVMAWASAASSFVGKCRAVHPDGNCWWRSMATQLGQDERLWHSQAGAKVTRTCQSARGHRHMAVRACRQPLHRG